MRGCNLLFVLLFLSLHAIGQSIKFLDQKDGRGIPDLNITLKDATGRIQSASTDQEGNLFIGNLNFPVSFQTSHINYSHTEGILNSSEFQQFSLTQSISPLKEVVVTGQMSPQSSNKSVYPVRIIQGEKIRARGATNLEDVLKTELNIRFSKDLALGASNISLQGLSGQNVKVLVDGVPITGRQGTSNEINISQINVNSIERVEIIEGPMSVIYGADALGGVINIITKKPEKEAVDVSAKIHEETIGEEYGRTKGIHNESIKASWKGTNGIMVLAEGDRNDFGGWKARSDEEWHPKEQWMGSVLTGLKKDKADVYYRLDALKENIYSQGIFTDNIANDQEFITRRFMHQLQGDFTINKKARLNSIIAYTDYSRRTLSTIFDQASGDRRLSLAEGSQDQTEFQGIVIRGWAGYQLSKVFSIQPGYDINLETGSGGRIKSGDQQVTDYAFFISSEITPFTWLNLKPGLRFVKNSIYNSPPVIPSFNTHINIIKGLDLRIGYGRGFRAPSIRELYFDFFDTNHAISGNTNLKAELSNNINGSVAWQLINKKTLSVTTNLGGFYNQIENLITIGVNPTDSRSVTYLNIGKYKTKGLIWTNNIKLKDFEFAGGFAYTGRLNNLNDQDKSLPSFVWSYEINSSITYKIPVINTRLNVFYKYTGETPYYEVASENGEQVARLAKTTGFHWADLTLVKSVGKLITLTGGMRNSFDLINIKNTSVTTGGAHSTGGSSTPMGYGRSYFLSLNFHWSKNIK